MAEKYQRVGYLASRYVNIIVFLFFNLIFVDKINNYLDYDLWLCEQELDKPNPFLVAINIRQVQRS